MTSFDMKIGEETQTQNQKDLNYENLKLQQEIQYLHHLIRESEYKRREQHRTTNNKLMWILIFMLIYIIPDMLIKIVKFFTLSEILQKLNILLQ